MSARSDKNNCSAFKPIESTKMAKAILDLINRQKAEIERLKYNLKAVLDERANHSEAIKEFMEKVENKIYTTEQIDNLLKELVGEDGQSETSVPTSKKEDCK